jgi:hypothetical protein
MESTTQPPFGGCIYAGLARILSLVEAASDSRQRKAASGGLAQRDQLTERRRLFHRQIGQYLAV